MPISPGAGATSQDQDTSLNSPPQASPSTLAGDSGAMPPDSAQPNSNEGLKQVTQQVRQLLVTTMDLARQFPAAAPAFRKATEGLRAGLKQIISNPGQPEPPAPDIGG